MSSHVELSSHVKSNRLAAGVPDPWVGLNPTARKILATAKKIIVERGFDALTLEAIAAEAPVNKAATRYHFGSKDGLIEAIVDEIVLTECAAIALQVPEGATIEERIDLLVDHVRVLVAGPEQYSAFYDILPHAVRTEALRKRLVVLYDVWSDAILGWLDLPRLDSAPPEIRAMAELVAAMVDGLTIQAMIRGREMIPEQSFEALRRCLALSFCSIWRRPQA